MKKMNISVKSIILVTYEKKKNKLLMGFMYVVAVWQ